MGEEAVKGSVVLGLLDLILADTTSTKGFNAI